LLKDFEFYKTIRLSTIDKLDAIFEKLKSVYSAIPDTKGCLEEHAKGKKGCAGWCCSLQTPQLLYSEFLLVWNFISKNWNNDQVCNLFEKCMLTAINEVPSKGCVFFDKKNKLCTIHSLRSLNCRIYGITPEKEFKPRYEKLKEEYKNIIGAVLKPQCELVSTINGSEVTVKDIERWWKDLEKIEEKIGIPHRLITDKVGGSYRTTHDHILLYNMPENILNSLAGIKMYENYSKRIETVSDIISNIRNHFQKKREKK